MRIFLANAGRWFDRPWRCSLIVFLIYFLTSFFATTFPLLGPPLKGMFALKFTEFQWATFSPPRVLRGDETHYLMVAHSLGGDRDLRLDDEYTSVLAGGPQMGAYWSSKLMVLPAIHAMSDAENRLIGKHPVGLSAFLALLLWPLADTFWFEPAGVWVTCAVAALGVAFFLRCLLALNVAWPVARRVGFLLAFASPWFSYSHSLLTEIYIGTGFLMVLDGVLRNQVWRSIPATIFLACFKYPALLIFFGAGCGEAVHKRWRNFFLIGLVGAATLIVISKFNDYLFQGYQEKIYHPVHSIATDASLEPDNIAATTTTIAVVEAVGEIIDTPIAFIPALPFENLREGLIGKQRGLLQTTPILFFAALGLIGFARNHPKAFRAWLFLLIPYALLHFCYAYLLTGMYYSLRYLIPCVPLLLLPLPWFMERGEKISQWMFRVAIAWSLLINVIAGLFPASTYAVGPKEILKAAYQVVAALFGFGPT